MFTDFTDFTQHTNSEEPEKQPKGIYSAQRENLKNGNAGTSAAGPIPAFPTEK